MAQTKNHYLSIETCPHCQVDKPGLTILWTDSTSDHRGANTRVWAVYKCNRCGGAVTAAFDTFYDSLIDYFPNAEIGVDPSLPPRAKEYLQQAISSVNAPAGAVILAASAVDEMLKSKGYTEGKLYPRIEQAKNDHVLTEDMAKWAHEVRLDANDQRHTDSTVPLPATQDATRAIEFANALGLLLFSLPARVKRGLEVATPTKKP